MSALWSRHDVRTAVYAAIFAAWCVAWVFGALEITRPLPGVLSLKGNGGAYEIVQWFTGQPTWMVAIAFAVLAFVLAWLLLKLLHWLDHEGEARAAFRWALSSTSLNLLIFTLPTMSVVIGLTLTPDVFDHGTMTVIFVVVAVLIAVLMPLSAFNPATLRQTRLQCWWRLMWPGWWPFVSALLLIGVVPSMTGFAVEVSAAGAQWPVWLILQSLESVVDSLAEIMMVVIWLCAGRLDDVYASLSRIANVRFLRSYLAYTLMIGMIVLPLAVPVIVHSLYFVYVHPQYEDLVQQSGLELPWSMQMLLGLKQWNAEWAWVPFVLSMAALLLFWLGRLMVRHGVGASAMDAQDR